MDIEENGRPAKEDKPSEPDSEEFRDADVIFIDSCRQSSTLTPQKEEPHQFGRQCKGWQLSRFVSVFYLMVLSNIHSNCRTNSSYTAMLRSNIASNLKKRELIMLLSP